MNFGSELLVGVVTVMVAVSFLIGPDIVLKDIRYIPGWRFVKEYPKWQWVRTVYPISLIVTGLSVPLLYYWLLGSFFNDVSDVALCFAVTFLFLGIPPALLEVGCGLSSKMPSRRERGGYAFHANSRRAGFIRLFGICIGLGIWTTQLLMFRLY